ncbi:hypothetical protein [Streptomyces sp. NPDC048419]|uniref:hypothetical protein n=1 Tax=Streptomyces sp. NPDC048419 TaxID=3365547 RepID=UPI00372447BD
MNALGGDEGDAVKLVELSEAGSPTLGEPAAMQGKFVPLLNLLWRDSSLWWEAFNDWNEFLAWANDRNGADAVYIAPDYGMDALDEALDALPDPSPEKKYEYLTTWILGKWAAVPESPEQATDLLPVGDVGEAKGWDAYDPNYEIAYDQRREIYLYRKKVGKEDGAWTPKLPPLREEASDTRYIGVKRYGTTGWWYGYDTQSHQQPSSQRWRYYLSDGKPTGKEGIGWKTEEETIIVCRPHELAEKAGLTGWGLENTRHAADRCWAYCNPISGTLRFIESSDPTPPPLVGSEGWTDKFPPATEQRERRTAINQLIQEVPAALTFSPEALHRIIHEAALRRPARIS